jgi:hypothetical protein
MKKILFVIFCMSLIFALCGVFTFATTENTPPPSSVENTGAEDNLSSVPEESESIETVIDKLTDSTLWINIGTVALACLGIIGTVASKFKVISDLISKKADNNTIVDTLKVSAEDIRKAFNDELEKVREEVKKAKEEEDKIFTILTLFITNAKINPAAKAEIMNYITGIKSLCGDPEEIVKKANEAIAEAIKAEEKPQTPALDAIVKESTMELG